MRVLILGVGYLGLPFGKALAAQGHEVFGVRHSTGGEAELQAARIQPLVADITDLASLRALPGPFDWVVNCVSSSKGGTDVYRQVYLQGTRNVIDWLAGMPPSPAVSTPSPPAKGGEGRGEEVRGDRSLAAPLPGPLPAPASRGEGIKKFVFTSSTSVYGQTDGSLVKEGSPTEPASETSRILVETENLLLDAARAKKLPAIILRLAGIYGPGRGHPFQQFLKGEARIHGDGARLLNMIHVDDAVGAIIAALKNGRAGEIYNVADDEPVTERHFFQWLSQELGKWMPPQASEAELAGRKRGVTNKKVANRRLKMELGYKFIFPTYRDGYTAEIKRLEDAGDLDLLPEPR